VSVRSKDENERNFFKADNFLNSVCFGNKIHQIILSLLQFFLIWGLLHRTEGTALFH
jgi:hypothetical protein